MADNYTFCPNCGTRNFKDDGVCGVCNSKLIPSQSASNETPINKSPKPKPAVRKATPIKKKAKEKQKSSAGAIWLFVIIGLLVFYYSIDGSGNSKPKEDLVTNSTYDASVVQVERYLKDEYLKDPDSYEGISWSSVVKLSETKEIGFASYQVRHKFRAKNGFGGYNVEEKIFKLDYKGNVVEIKDWLY